jgi:long-chain acyl-CoA synthetase
MPLNIGQTNASDLLRLDQLLARRAQECAAQPFVHAGELTLTYAETDALVSTAADALRRRNVAGRFIGLCAPNSPAFVIGYFAILRAGGMVVPVNPKLGTDEIAYIAGDAHLHSVVHPPAVTIMDGNPTPLLSAGTVCLHGTPVPATLQGQPPRFPADLADVAVCIYTSGTTGRPKGALLSHRALLHNARMCARGLQSQSNHECFVTVLPLFHAFAASACMLHALWSASRILLVEQFSPLEVLRQMARVHATVFLGVPSMYAVLAQVEQPPAIPSWRLCVAGGAPLPAVVAAAFLAAFKMPIYEGDGPTECGPATSINPIGGTTKIGTIGRPLPGVTMRIVADDLRDVPDGTVGEIVVRSPSNFNGYLNQPEETARTLVDGWVRTGDLGTRDADGYFSIVDRKKDMLIVGGLNVYSREVEEYIRRHPAVHDVAVIGVPDDLRGEAPAAFVVPRAGATLSLGELKRFLRGKLAAYKIPRHLHLCDTLPRNATGKILKTALRAMAEAAAADRP